MGEEAALGGGGGGGGAILSGTGLSCWDRDERVSNLLDTSREAVVSNNEVEKSNAISAGNRTFWHQTILAPRRFGPEMFWP